MKKKQLCQALLMLSPVKLFFHQVIQFTRIILVCSLTSSRSFSYGNAYFLAGKEGRHDYVALKYTWCLKLLIFFKIFRNPSPRLMTFRFRPFTLPLADAIFV